MTMRCSACGSKTTDIIIRIGYGRHPEITYNEMIYTYPNFRSFRKDLNAFVKERMTQEPD